MDLKIIYQDDSILVVDKPAGLVVDQSKTQKGEVLADILQRDYKIELERGGIVHRLDKDTSGILLVAKTQQALENLQSQFKQRKVKKEYLALVHGSLEKPGRIEGNIGRNPGNREKFTVLNVEGKEAITAYSPVMNYNKFTLLSCHPHTGRTHQIRVHLKHIGFPIVSDEKYVGRKMYRLDKKWCPRMFLHAKKIGFYHPKSGEWVELKAQLPEELRKVLWTTFSYNWQ